MWGTATCNWKESAFTITKPLVSLFYSILSIEGLRLPTCHFVKICLYFYGISSESFKNWYFSSCLKNRCCETASSIKWKFAQTLDDHWFCLSGVSSNTSKSFTFSRAKNMSKWKIIWFLLQFLKKSQLSNCRKQILEIITASRRHMPLLLPIVWSKSYKFLIFYTEIKFGLKMETVAPKCARIFKKSQL